MIPTCKYMGVAGCRTGRRNRKSHTLIMFGLKRPSQLRANVHWSAGVALVEEIQGKQPQNHLMAEPDNCVKGDRICAQALHKSSNPTLLLPENVGKLQCWSVQQQLHHKLGIHHLEASVPNKFRPNETPDLETMLASFDLNVYKFNKIQWVIWVISGFPFLCNYKPNKF